MFRKIFILYITTFIFTIILSFASYAQTPITGGTTWGTEIVVISPDTNISKISDLLKGTGLDKISCKFITLDGKNNQLKIDVPYLSGEFDLDTGGGELKTGFEVLSLFISSSRGEEDNWIGVEGSLGGHAIRFELSFKPGFKTITSSTAQDPSSIEDTTFRIRLFNEDSNTFKTLFEKSTTKWQENHVKNYLKGKNFPVSFNIYLASLDVLDSYEIKFIDALEGLPEDIQIYYAKEVYNNGFSQILLKQLLNEASKTIQRKISTNIIIRLTKNDDKEALMERFVQDSVNANYSTYLNEYRSICGVSGSYIKCDKTFSNNGACLIFTAEGSNMKYIVTIDCDFTWDYVDSIKK